MDYQGFADSRLAAKLCFCQSMGQEKIHTTWLVVQPNNMFCRAFWSTDLMNPFEIEQTSTIHVYAHSSLPYSNIEALKKYVPASALRDSYWEAPGRHVVRQRAAYEDRQVVSHSYTSRLQIQP